MALIDEELVEAELFSTRFNGVGHR
jgi:hypothetical protein